jgi:hypothetical protein
MPQNPLTFNELPALRKTTEAISQDLQQRLTSYLDTLKPLFAPERFLGRHVGGKTDVLGADKSVAQITQAYREVGGKPFDLPREFEPEWLGTTGSRLELHRLEYIHQATSGSVTKPIRITSPLRWIITYGSAITPFQALQILSGKERATNGSLRQFVVNALVMQLVLMRNPGFTELFNDLRFELRTELFTESGKLPFMTITSCLPSFRPADDLILTATEFSGVPAFIELLDTDAVERLEDPLKKHVTSLLG